MNTSKRALDNGATRVNRGESGKPADEGRGKGGAKGGVKGGAKGGVKSGVPPPRRHRVRPRVDGACGFAGWSAGGAGGLLEASRTVSECEQKKSCVITARLCQQGCMSVPVVRTSRHMYIHGVIVLV